MQENFTPRLAQKDLDALNAKSEPDRKRWWQSECDRRTGRIVAAQTGPGRFTVEGTGALALRLLLDERMFEPKKPIEVRWQGKTVKAPPQTSARVLLLEFVERFDRTFLPVVEIGLP